MLEIVWCIVRSNVRGVADQDQQAIGECDPLGVSSCVVSTHMNNKRYGETFYTTIAIRNYYSNKMTAIEDLAAYCSRCRTLLFIKNESNRLADEDAPEHTDEFHSVLLTSRLNINYSEYFNTFKNKVKNMVRPLPKPTRARLTSLWASPSTTELPRTRRSETFSQPVGVGERASVGEAAEAATARVKVELGMIPPAARVRGGQALPIGKGKPPRREGGVVPYRSTVRNTGAVTTAARRATIVMSVKSRRRRTHLRVTLIRKSKCRI